MHLGPLTIAEREEIVREITAHIRDSAEESGASIEAVLARLGPAEELAKQYREGLLIRQASRSLSPLVLLRATLRLATKGLSGIVVAAVLAAAMSSMSSAMNSMSAVFITDIYRRHLAANRDDRHYVRVAKLSTLVSSAIMIGGAFVLVRSETKTLQHFYVEFTSIIAGGLLGLYLLGLLTTRGDGRSVGLGIAFAVGFSTLVSFAGLGWLPAGFTRALESRFDSYYTGLASNLVMFAVGFALAFLLPERPRDLRNLTLWTQDKQPLD